MFQIVIFILIVLLASAAYAATQGAPWVPTWKKDLERIARLADLKAGERFVELGAGNARVCRYISRVVPGARVEGVELSVLQWAIGWLQNRLSGSRARMRLGNAFGYNLSDADVVYMFLMPQTYAKIRPKLEAQLIPGSRVVTYAWPIEGWEPEMVDEVEGSQKIYLYVRQKEEPRAKSSRATSDSLGDSSSHGA